MEVAATRVEVRGKPDMSDQLQTPSREGWFKPAQARQFHWFGRDHKSLCGRWMTFSADLDPATNNSPDDCRSCRKSLDNRPAAGGYSS